jgi:hypothetical protein
MTFVFAARSSQATKQELSMSYDPATTAILLVDPYNDFLSDGGKLWSRVKAIARLSGTG